MKSILIAALEKVVSDFKALKWSEVSYENYLKAVNQEEVVDMGDWEDNTSDHDLGLDRSDYEEGEEGEDGEDEYLDARTEAYKKYIEDRFDDFYYKYKKLKFPLTLYRAVCLKNLDELNRDKLGVYWSDDEESAQCYSGDTTGGKTYFTLVAEIDRDDIDWTFTISNNLNPSFGDDEQEINILENTKVKIVDVLDHDGSMGISFVGNTGSN